jgi:hypothetical protein
MLLYTDSQDLRAEADGIAAPGSLGDKTQDKAQAEVNKLYTDADGKQTLALLLGITGGMALSVSLWSWAAAPSDAIAVGIGPSEVRLTLWW